MYYKKLLSQEEILFRDNFSLILIKSKTIIETPEFYNCKPSFIGMANPHAAPNLSLGNLCQLWAEGKFIDTCDMCKGIRYIFGGSGNLGGGISDNKGICTSCRQLSSKVGLRTGPSIYTPMLFTYMEFLRSEKFKHFRNIKGSDIADILSIYLY